MRVGDRVMVGVRVSGSVTYIQWFIVYVVSFTHIDPADSVAATSAVHPNVRTLKVSVLLLGVGDL